MTKRSKEFENAVAGLLDTLRIPYKRVSSYRCFKCGQVQNSSAAGFPDFLLLDPFIAVECKTGKGRLSNEQKECKAYFDKAGIPWITLHDNLDELIEELGI